MATLISADRVPQAHWSTGSPASLATWITKYATRVISQIAQPIRAKALSRCLQVFSVFILGSRKQQDLFLTALFIFHSRKAVLSNPCRVNGAMALTGSTSSCTFKLHHPPNKAGKFPRHSRFCYICIFPISKHPMKIFTPHPLVCAVCIPDYL